MTLKLTHNVTKKEYTFDVTDANDSRLFYHFSTFQLTEVMNEGTYGYKLYDKDDKEVATGILQIGDYKNNTTQYTKQENGYKQYNG